VEVWRADLRRGAAGGGARELLRGLLGSYLQRDPAELRFVLGPHGKPLLTGFAGVGFNLSHSGSLALFAFTAGELVGVDVEVLARRGAPRDVLPVAARVFGGEVARGLEALEPHARQREFLRLWVRHEAVLKCLGVGLLGREGGAAPGRGPELDGGAAELEISELELGASAVGAVAVRGGFREVRLRDWGSGAQGS
jgi:4'-phosphopantetheinyl transferase